VDGNNERLLTPGEVAAPHCSGWIRRPSPAGRPPGGSRASEPREDTAGSVSLKYGPCCGATANQHRNRKATRRP